MEDKNKDILYVLKSFKDELKKKYRSYNDRKMLRESDLVFSETDNDAHFIYEDGGIKKEFTLKCNATQKEIIAIMKEEAFSGKGDVLNEMNAITTAFGKPSNMVLQKVYVSHKDGKIHYGYTDANFVSI